MIFVLLSNLLSIYAFVIVVRMLLSWVPDLIDPYHPAMQFLHQITEPVLEPARRLIPPIGMIDISATVVIFVILFLADMLQKAGNNF